MVTKSVPLRHCGDGTALAGMIVNSPLKTLQGKIIKGIDDLAEVARHEILLKAVGELADTAEKDELVILIDHYRDVNNLIFRALDNLKDSHKIVKEILSTGVQSESFFCVQPKYQIRQRIKRFLRVEFDEDEGKKGIWILGEIRGFLYNPSKNKWVYAVKWADETEYAFEKACIYYDEEEIMPIDNLEGRVKRHAALLQAIAQSGCVCVTLHALDESLGFPYLEVIAPLPERLNKPREQVLGQSCLSVDPRIGEPRFHALKKAVASGLCENYHYTYDDEFHWKFNVTVAPLYGREELISIVSDAESWQLGHWLNKLK